jgi:Ca2+/H+ antiporter
MSRIAYLAMTSRCLAIIASLACMASRKADMVAAYGTMRYGTVQCVIAVVVMEVVAD